ncbi:MAG TPA: hypothetical protein PK296_05730, partial [Paludibacteraceae bacterium]|nr:hypothetical protein [Paludibacteraceae bacterium]HOV83829.1 hypothetical protein [Paludibacteraceae bacterium]
YSFEKIRTTYYVNFAKLGLDKSKVILMTQDEGRFGRVNIPRNCLAPKQVRPLVAKQVVRESFYVYAGICPK